MSRGERGFSMIMVVMLLAVTSISAAVLLNTVGADIFNASIVHRTLRARSVAEGAVMEVIDDDRTRAILPDFASTALTANYTPSAQSAFKNALTGDYTASVKLLRFVPLAESSQTWSRALVYEVTADATVSNGDGGSQLSSEIFRVISIPPGIMLPFKHAR